MEIIGEVSPMSSYLMDTSPESAQKPQRSA
jgi:hypothetical protein